MRYWWVSQNQTFRFEVPGGYLWSPKSNRDGSINPYYEMMREVAHGDIVFSFNDKKIMAIGVAVGPAYTCPKPHEFGAAGAYWDQVGWRVDVQFNILSNQIAPKEYMQVLSPLLSKKYSPIRQDGTGNQMYLTEISEEFARMLVLLIGYEAKTILKDAEEYYVAKVSDVSDFKRPEILQEWEMVEIDKINNDSRVGETDRVQVIKSRKGQGVFRNRVAEIEKQCRITKVNQAEHLIASHIKPWMVSTNQERLDGQNGLFLTPNIDHLFGNGYLSFRDNGDLLVSPIAHRPSLIRMGVDTEKSVNVGRFLGSQSSYLEYHRDCVFLQKR